MESAGASAFFNGRYERGTDSCTVVLEKPVFKGSKRYSDTRLTFEGHIPKGSDNTDPDRYSEQSAAFVPERISRMIQLYDYGDWSMKSKAVNFIRQGRFMEDYEDDSPWNGEFRRYFTTYHDLNIPQLRGYFTWRSHVRKGEYLPISTSLAYMYIYELLCGIGSSCAQDTLDKMDSFEKGFVDSGIGDPLMRRNLHRWMFEYAVIHDLPPETACRYADGKAIERDEALSVLKDPPLYGDEEIFEALCVFAGSRLLLSPVVSQDKRRGAHLFSGVWRYMSKNYREEGRDIFTACFGRKRIHVWHPLSNAVYHEDLEKNDRDYDLNKIRSYHLRNGTWKEKRFEPLYFNRDRFNALIRESDRLFRKEMKSGRYLKEREEESWVSPYVAAVIEEERRLSEEEKQAQINIDLSGLEHIRQDALVTKELLLTEEEMREEIPDESCCLQVPKTDISPEGLGDVHLKILKALLNGDPADEIIKSEHLMTSVACDTINEALFDEIGDNVLECSGNSIVLREEYREDVMEIAGGIVK